MNQDKPLVNRVANSGIITINLEHYFPETEVIPFDLKDYLFMELILKEKDFRTALKRTRLVAIRRQNPRYFLLNRCHHSHLGLHACNGQCNACCKRRLPRYAC
ncbi:MAG: DUF2480 family protein [Bacteroidota bacterium]